MLLGIRSSFQHFDAYSIFVRRFLHLVLFHFLPYGIPILISHSKPRKVFRISDDWCSGRWNKSHFVFLQAERKIWRTVYRFIDIFRSSFFVLNWTATKVNGNRNKKEKDWRNSRSSYRLYQEDADGMAKVARSSKWILYRLLQFCDPLCWFFMYPLRMMRGIAVDAVMDFSVPVYKLHFVCWPFKTSVVRRNKCGVSQKVATSPQGVIFLFSWFGLPYRA